MKNRYRAVLLLLGLAVWPLRAEIVDRILAVAGDRVLTWSAALAEADYQAFREGREPPSWGPPASAISDDARQVVSRLIDQALLEQAMARSPFSAPPDEDFQAPLRELQQRFSSPDAYREALARYRLTEEEVVARLARERQLMAFVDATLRPQVRISPQQIEDYYQSSFLPEWQRRQDSASVPPLSEVQGQIEEILGEQEINRLLERWLADLRRGTSVKIWAE
jgi:hypothetical protein